VRRKRLAVAYLTGGFTSPVHFGSLISAEHFPVHVPSHVACVFIWHEPPQIARASSPSAVPP